VLAADADGQARLDAAALLGRHAHQLAHGGVQGDEGVDGQDADVDVERQEARAIVALMPKVVCVRSLVPKLKKSASTAISSAVRQARGSSIIVPTLYGTSTLPSSSTRGRWRRRPRAERQLADVAHQRDHDHRVDGDPVVPNGFHGRLEDGAHLHLVDLGVGQARRQPR
jgi:hypothetical protein